jgi:hypothetical protein
MVLLPNLEINLVLETPEVCWTYVPDSNSLLPILTHIYLDYGKRPEKIYHEETYRVLSRLSCSMRAVALQWIQWTPWTLPNYRESMIAHGGDHRKIFMPMDEWQKVRPEEPKLFHNYEGCVWVVPAGQMCYAPMILLRCRAFAKRRLANEWTWKKLKGFLPQSLQY